MFQKTAAGKDVDFTQSHGASGEQTRAVKAGLEADLAALSLARRRRPRPRPPGRPDLGEAALLGHGHELARRLRRADGNPKKIRGWNDLLRPDVDVVTPNPFTGGARWNVMAAHGAAPRREDGQAGAGEPAEALPATSSSRTRARDSLNTFVSGKGDVLLAYENEALFSRTKGLDLQFVIPKSTILIENLIAVVKTSKEKAAAPTRSSASCRRSPRSRSSPTTGTGLS